MMFSQLFFVCFVVFCGLLRLIGCGQDSMVESLTGVQQGPQNLYGRDGKFRPTFKSVMEKRLFSVPLLITWCPQSAPNCTDLHLYFQKISRVTPPNHQNWEFHPRLLHSATAHCPTFTASAAAGVQSIGLNYRLTYLVLLQPAHFSGVTPG